jgi:uncharacterized cupredoxin-like copper-binding protein
MTIRWASLPLAAAAVLVLAGLALHGQPNGLVGGASAGTQIVIRDGRFSPNRIDVQAGRAINLRVANQDSVAHDLYIPSRHMPGLSGAQAIVPPNETRTITLSFDDPGIHAFQCSVPGHAAPQMTGAIFVHR